MNKLYINLAKTNMKNNKPLYIPYILSGIMTVAMFYLMMFLNNNEGLKKIPGAMSLRSILGLGVFVIAIFAYIFVFYTNSFIIKRRKKEIGVYNILGMEKRHIARVLAMETVFVAFLAIASGLFIGILFSKLMLMLLYRILGFEESIAFSIAEQGVEITLIVFGVLYLLTLFYNMMQIKLANPIELLRGGNVGEKEPKTKLLMTIAGAACLGTAYFIAITSEKPLTVLPMFFVAVVLVIFGTYFLFTAGSIALLKALRKNKKFYYNKKHYTAVSGMLYRMKQNAAGLASICVLSTMVLVMISTTVSMYMGVDDKLVTRYPMEICLYSDFDSAMADTDQLEEKLRGLIEENGREVTDSTAYAYFYMLMDHEGSDFSASDNDRIDGTTALVNIITRENLIALDKEFSEKSVEKVPEGSVWVYASRPYEEKSIIILGEVFPVAGTVLYEADQDMYLANMVDGDYYVVVDGKETEEKLFQIQRESYSEQPNDYQNVIGMDIDGTTQEKINCAEAIRPIIQENTLEHCTNIYMEGRQTNKKEFYTIYGGLFFLGIFLGSMFLMVTVMIIFYKQISEGYDDKERYEIMEKVGMSSLEVKTSIQSQVRMVFFLPILTAAVHVTAAFPMLRRLLGLLNLTNTGLFIRCLILTILIFTAIYYCVFKITSRSYYKIVGNQVQ